MLKPEGIGSIYLVTHAWHMRRAVLAFRHFGIAATAAPTHFSGPTMPDAASLVPSAKGWMESSYALHEWIGFLWYALAR